MAGSGKTSIALHRIAFLLYRFKDTLASSDILIISPNRVFADYIGNVLPELGEETVPEIGMETLAAQMLGDKIRFQSFFEQTARLLESDDAALKERIAARRRRNSLRQIEAYATHLEKTKFQPEDMVIRRRPLPGFVFRDDMGQVAPLDMAERITATGNQVIEQFEAQYNIELRKEERAVIRKAARGMVNRTTLRKAYKGLFDWIERPRPVPPRGGKLEHADVFPLIYLKMLTEGVENPYAGVKHLLVDEMQDYTPVQYAVLARLFKCRKTILGDATQSVNPYSASSPERIEAMLDGAYRVTLNKSYRSTWEIMQFALPFRPTPTLSRWNATGRSRTCRWSRRRARLLRASPRRLPRSRRPITPTLRCWPRRRARRSGFTRRWPRRGSRRICWPRAAPASRPVSSSARHTLPRGWNSIG